MPVLKTQRLALRQITPRDADIFYALRADPRVVQYSGIPPYHAYDQAVEDVFRLIHACSRKEANAWIVMLRDGPAVGAVCLRDSTGNRRCFNLWYELLPAFQGKGIMGEALNAAMDYAFEEMLLEKVVADPRIDNIPSVKVLEKNGFALLEQVVGHDGFHHGLYELDRDAYRKRKARG